MRRHFQPTPTPPVSLSLEEEAIIADEVNQQINDIADTAADNERLGDIIVTMGDVETVVSNTPEIKSIEQTLIGAVADMAVAGTDADPEKLIDDMLPPDEAMSTESLADNIKETLSKLWTTIKNMMEKMWSQIGNFFGHIGQFLTGTKRRVDQLESLLNANPTLTAPPGEKPTFKGNANLLSLYGTAPKDLGGAYHDFVAFANGAVTDLHVQGMKLMDAGGRIFEVMVADMTAADKNMDGGIVPFEHALSTLKKNLSHGNDEQATQLGGFKFICDFPGTDGSKRGFDDVLQHVAQFKMGVGLEQPKVALKPIPLSLDINTIKKLVDPAKQWLKLVEAKSAEIARMADKAKAVRSHLESGVQKVAQAKEVDAEIKRRLALILNLNGRVHSQVANALHGIVARGGQISNAVLDYGIQSVKAGTGQVANPAKPKTPEKALA